MARAYKLPLCNKCGYRHYNFQGCVAAAAARKLPEGDWPMPEGFRSWGPDREKPWAERVPVLGRPAAEPAVEAVAKDTDGPSEAT